MTVIKRQILKIIVRMCGEKEPLVDSHGGKILIRK